MQYPGIESQNRVYIKNTGCGGSCSLGTLADVALLVIACCAVAGVFPSGPTMGWVTLGLGAGVSVITLLGFGLAKSKFWFIVTALKIAAFVTLGLLGGIGILSSVQVGWGVIGTFCGTLVLASVYSIYFFSRRDTRRFIFSN